MRTAGTVTVFCAFLLLGLTDPADLAARQPNTSLQTLPTKSIQIDLIVTDENGRSVDDIKVEELELTVNGEPQKVSYLEKVDKRVIYSLLIDSSRSFQPLLGRALAAVKVLMDGNRSNDETMLVSFVSSDQIRTVVPFTSDKSKLLQTTLDNFTPLSGQTALLDALYVSAETTIKHKPNDSDARRAVFILTDGEDRSSYYDVSKRTKLLREQKVQVFMIGLIDKLEDAGFMRPNVRAKAEQLLKDIANESGGLVFFPKNQEKLLEAAEQIVGHLHSQYVVGFDRSAYPGEKAYQKLKVRIARTSPRQKLKVIARPGFWVRPPETQKKN